MKKFTFLAAASMVAMAASAQYTVDPATSVVAAQNPTNVAYIALDDESVAELEAKGAKTEYIGPDGAGRNLWVWDETFTAGDSSYPGVNGFYDYLSLSVGSVGWSGAGYNLRPKNDETGEEFAGANLSWFNDDTRFHIAYMSSATPPPSIALILMNGDADGSSPANIALGANFNDNGTIYQAVGPVAGDDWQGIDISFADLKKFTPGFTMAGLDNWYGNILSFLAGGVTGQTFSFDCIYFYNTGAPVEGPGDEPGEGPGPEVVDLYIVGNNINGEADWNTGGAMTYDNGIYTWTGSELGSGFKFNNGGWSDANYNIGAEDDSVLLEVGVPYPVVAAGDSKNINFDGDPIANPTVVLDMENMTVTVTGDAGVEGIVADSFDFVVTANTINLNGGANGMVLYDMAGKAVKQTNGCVLGLDGLAKGVYVVKSGDKVRKVVVR